MNRILLSLVILFFVTNLFAAAWTGSTSEPENMRKIDGKSFYVITSADELAWFAAEVNGGKNTINAFLANDIDADGGNWTTIESFGGVIDGNNRTIKNFNRLFINKVTSSGIVKNITVERNSGYIDYSKNGTTSDFYNSKGFVAQNYGLIDHITNFSKIYYGAGIAYENFGTIRNCVNEGIIGGSDVHSFPKAGISITNNGLIEYCVNNGAVYGYGGGISYTNNQQGIIRCCENSGELRASIKRNGAGNVIAKYLSNDISRENGGLIINSIYTTSVVENNVIDPYGEASNGLIKNSFGKTTYWLNNTKVTSTAEKMQTDQFAWILNTMNGTAANSKVWSRTNGYPIYATDDYKPIYKVVFNDDGTTSNRYTNYKGQVSFPEDPEPAEGYVFTGWYNGNDVRVKPSTVFTSDQTVNSVYVDASNVFWTINFYNSDTQSTLLETHQYQHGSIVTYGGATPTRVATAKYTYTFKGWDVEPTNAVEDFDYHAVYDSTLRSYTITFNDYNGSKIESKSFKYGVTPSCSKTPARPATVEWNYTHKGWTPELASVTGEASYKATYDSAKVQYKVTFMNGTEIVDEQMIPYGSAAVAPTNVTREGHKFVGWNVSFSRVTEAITVKALFEELITHTVDIVNADGETIGSVNVEEDANYTLPEAPDKEGYTFDAYYDGETRLGVAGDEILVSANIIIIARYIENPKSSSSGVVKSSSSKATISSSSNSAMQVVVDGKLEQAVAIGEALETIVFKNVQGYQRNSWNMYFLNERWSGNELAISGTVPDYPSFSNYTETLTINGQQYTIKLSVLPSVNSSSGTGYISNSSGYGINSSVSGNAMPVFASTIVQFSVETFNRNLQILGAKVGSAYAIFDMQGRVLKKGRVESANFNIPLVMAGNFLVRVGNHTQRITIK